MSSQQATLLSRFPPTLSKTTYDDLPKFFPVSLSVGGSRKWATTNARHKCLAVSKPYYTQGNTLISYNGAPPIKLRDIVEDDLEEKALEIRASDEIVEQVSSIRAMLDSMGEGEITVSPYDTAWVALVEDPNHAGTPQFPSTLQWIADNQLAEGSWAGDPFIFFAHDRIINTLACVIALKKWNLHPEKCERGVLFVEANIGKLGAEAAEHMPIGFEVAFPSLIETAKGMGIEVVSSDCPVLRDIYAKRDIKLAKIPKSIMEEVPTTLLHSLEGMAGLAWEKLLRLQCPDGSFLFSPSSTAYALMQTQHPLCFAYLHKAVERFNGGVPNVYPVDLFERIWVVDRLHRLGISRHFTDEVRECVDYVHRYWTERGICWARNTVVYDIDDTAMGFRILRLHGHDVSADVVRHFECGGEFFCFKGQSTTAVTGIFNLYRASQLAFPGEEVLEEAKTYAFTFLKRKLAANELLDKWIIMKDLPGEVKYALDFPWYASLPRVETSYYIKQYGGQNDVWIGKTLYRMPYVNNDMYLELAKQDYNSCQGLHQLEWNSIQKWYENCEASDFGVSKRDLLQAYFLAAASVFEPERSKERLAWAKTRVLTDMVAFYFNEDDSSSCGYRKSAFIRDFITNTTSNSRDIVYSNSQFTRRGNGRELLEALLETLSYLSLETLVAHGKDIHRHLCKAWEMWMEDAHPGEAEILVRTINLCSQRGWVVDEVVSQPQYKALSALTIRVCRQLRHFEDNKDLVKGGKNVNTGNMMTTPEIESNMRKLAQMVLRRSPEDTVDYELKQTFLAVAKSCYYTAYCAPEVVESHIHEVLFNRVA